MSSSLPPPARPTNSLLILYALAERFHSGHGFNYPIYDDDSQTDVSSSEFSLELQFHSFESSSVLKKCYNKHIQYHTSQSNLLLLLFFLLYSLRW